MWPIRSPFGLRTAVPSTRSLAINWCGFAMTSVIITLLLWVDEAEPTRRLPAGSIRSQLEAASCRRLGGSLPGNRPHGTKLDAVQIDRRCHSEMIAAEHPD